MRTRERKCAPVTILFAHFRTRGCSQCRAAGGQPTELFRGSSHVWDAAGRRVYYVNQEAAGGTRIEAAELEHSGAGPTVGRVQVVGVSTGTLRDLAITADGKHVLATAGEESLNLSRIPLAPGGGDVAGPEEELSSGQVRDRYPAVSPDGRRIALSSNRIGDDDLWIVELPAARWRRVQMPSSTGYWITQACWSPDGLHLGVWRFFRNGTGALWYVAIDGSSTEQLRPPTLSLSGNIACAFSPDGRRLVHAHFDGTFSQLFMLDVATRQEQRLTQSPSHKYDAAWSPDGRWVAFAANTDGTVQIWRIPAAGGQEQRLTTGYERMRHPFYSPDGRWLYVQPSHRNMPMGPVYAFRTIVERTEVRPLSNGGAKARFAVSNTLDRKIYNGSLTLEFTAPASVTVASNGKKLAERATGATDRWNEEFVRREGNRLFVTVRSNTTLELR